MPKPPQFYCCCLLSRMPSVNRGSSIEVPLQHVNIYIHLLQSKQR